MPLFLHVNPNVLVAPSRHEQLLLRLCLGPVSFAANFIQGTQENATFTTKHATYNNCPSPFQEAFQELADLNGATSVSVTFGQEAPHLQLSAKGSIGSRYVPPRQVQ